MRKVVVLLAVVALTAPALAARVDSAPVKWSGTVTSLSGTRDTNHVYEAIGFNGYYTPWTPDDAYKAELCYVTAAAPWTMDEFNIGFVAGPGTVSVPVEFWEGDGLGWFGAYIGGFTLSFDLPQLGAYTASIDISATPLTFNTTDVWMLYINDPTLVGIMHSDPPTIGSDYYANGWIEYDGTGYHWWWYGGTPNADLYMALNAVPEPGALALLALGGLALIRRR